MSVMAQLRADEAIFPESTIGSEQASPRESANVVEQASVSEGATRNEPASLEGAIDPERGMITESTTAKEHNGYVKPDGTPTAAGWREIGKNLRKPMPSKQRPGRGGTFSYIDARQVMNRLDAVVGPGNWENRFRIIDASMHVVECTISIFGISKTDVGYSNNPDSDDESEPMKAAYSDAFKRAAVHWQIGRWLYE